MPHPILWCLTALILSAACIHSSDPDTTDDRCGDGVCAQDEGCRTCAADCGACQTCGDGACDGSETCSSCAEDCGVCMRRTCGDGECGEGEECGGCPEDCGECPVEPFYGDGECFGDESCADCVADCGACGASACRNGVQDADEEGVDCGGACLACDYPQERSYKRGMSYNFCDWSFSQGQDDADLLTFTERPGGGATWYYNWGMVPTDCFADSPTLRDSLEYVPMIWTLHDRGADCGDGGACFGGGFTADEIIAMLPPQTRTLLGYNEPNFAYQAHLTPTEAARGWTQLEVVADARGLQLVGPSPNFCDPTPGANHPGVCTREPSTLTYNVGAYTETVPAGFAYNVFTWFELFYDACSAAGVAGHDCRIDYQAVHVYSYWGAAWILDLMKIKAGLEPPTEAHCANGEEDEDEFGVDCGGQACPACTAWARAQFAKPVWVTEFAPATDDAGSPQSPEQLEERLQAYISSEINAFEADPYVARYAWFMPKTDIGSLDHVDLLTEFGELDYTPAGENYLNQPH